MRLKRFVYPLLLLLWLPAAAAAQPQPPRTLEIQATAAWGHAGTGMTLPPDIAGLTRGEIRDAGTEEMDVAASYVDAGGTTTATVYIFRTGVPDVALWFDRALAAIYARPEFELSGGPPHAHAFTRPGATVASGMQTAIAVQSSDIRSTALAVAPLGDWLVKVRMSTSGLDAAALDQHLTRFIEGMGWPAASSAERAAATIETCPEPLRLRQARVIRSDGADVLMDLLAVAATGADGGEEDDTPPPVYCREPSSTVEYGVYRPDQSSQSYVIALGDAGIALSVGRASLSELMGGGRRYSMMLLDRNSTSALPSFNRLPPPAQAISVAFAAQSSISVTSDR